MSISLSGINVQPTAWSLTETWTNGWKATLRLAQWLDIRSIGPTDPVKLTITDLNSHSLTSPTLIVGPRGRGHSRTRETTLDLLDLTSWLLGDGSKSWDTFLDVSSEDIIDAVADTYDITINGAPDFPIYQEDCKLVNGWNVIERVRKVAAQGYTVETNDDLTLRDWDWTSGTSSFKPATVRDHWDPLARYGRLFASKNLGLGTSSGPQYFDFTTAGKAEGELHWPLASGALARSESAVGSVAWVGLWNGPPATADLLAVFDLGGIAEDAISIGVTSGSWPATHYNAIVYPSLLNSSLPVQARLRIDGNPANPLPAGVEGAIGKEYGSGRGAPFQFSDSMIPSESFAQSHYQAWLAMANSGTNTLTATGPLDCSCRVGQTWGWAPLGLSGRIEQVTHSQSGGAPQTEILVNCDV